MPFCLQSLLDHSIHYRDFISPDHFARDAPHDRSIMRKVTSVADSQNAKTQLVRAGPDHLSLQQVLKKTRGELFLLWAVPLPTTACPPYLHQVACRHATCRLRRSCLLMDIQKSPETLTSPRSWLAAVTHASFCSSPTCFRLVRKILC